VSTRVDGAHHRGIQVHNRYLVAESPEGLIVIDQHALHERVLYERLREKILSGALETQRLLVPEPVTLAPAEAGMVLDHRETLATLGIQVEPFGGDTVLVVSYPAILTNLNPGEVLRQAVELLMSGVGKAERRDLVDELLHMMACKAAVKAGDRLAPEEVAALLEHRELCQDAHHCPHGRPTALYFSREENDILSKRISTSPCRGTKSTCCRPSHASTGSALRDPLVRPALILHGTFVMICDSIGRARHTQMIAVQ